MTTTEQVSVDAGERSEPVRRPPTRLTFWLFLASIVIAIVPIAVATTRAIHDGWIPTGDNALFAIRARDLFTHNLPLLGSWSSASLNTSTQLNHPGPLYFDLLAVPARLGDSGAGVAFGAALLNALSIVGIAVFAYRRGGALVGSAAMAATATLSWTMGSELLFEPWNPHSALLPFLFFLVLVWSAASGDLPALPFAAGVGSLLVQTHLSYALLIPILGGWAIAGLAVTLKRDRRGGGAGWASRRRRVFGIGAVALAVLVVCWLQPVIEQFTSDGDGNITRLVDNARSSKAGTIGVGFGTRVVATVVSLPPWWFRPSMRDAFTNDWHAPGLGFAVLSLVVVFAVLGWCAWSARRRRDRVSTTAVVTAVVGLAAALITAWQGPVTVFGDVTPHTFRWLWPLGAFVFFAVAITVGRRLTRDGLRTDRTAWLVGGFAAVTLLVAVLNLPYADEGSGPNSQEYAIPTAHDLDRQMGALQHQGPLVIDDLFRGVFADPFGGSTVAELQRRGIPFLARDPMVVRQFGPGRVYNGHNARAELLLRVGAGTEDPPPGSRRVALARGLSAADRRERARLGSQLAAYVEAGNLELNARGEAALARGDLPNLSQFRAGAADARSLFDSREIDAMVERHLLDVHGVRARRLERYAELERRADLETVALFLRPLGNTASS